MVLGLMEGDWVGVWERLFVEVILGVFFDCVVLCVVVWWIVELLLGELLYCIGSFV